MGKQEAKEKTVSLQLISEITGKISTLGENYSEKSNGLQCELFFTKVTSETTSCIS